MPVPTETKMTFAWPRAAPNRNSAQALALPSLSTVTGRPTMAATLARSGSPRQARFGANATVPAASSTKPAAPTPTAPARWRPSSSVTTSAITAAVRAGLAAGVARRTFSTIWPRSSTTPAATLVPPTSTPIVRLMRGFFRSFRCRRHAGGRSLAGRGLRGRRTGGGSRSGRAGGGSRSGRAGGGSRSGRAGGGSHSGRAAGGGRGGSFRGRWGAGSGGREAAGARRGLVPAAIGARAAAGGCQGRLEHRHRVLDHGGERITHGRHADVPPWLGLTDDPGRPAQRAPGTFGCLTGRRLGRGGLPHVATRLVPAKSGTHLVGQFPAHPAGTGTQQPALKVTDQVAARPAWLCHLVSPPPVPGAPVRLSTRFLSPPRAVSMIVFSARRFSSPGIGIRTSTDSS